MFLRTIASTAVSGIGQWDRMGQEGVDLCLTCRAEDGRKLMSVNQLGDGHVEVFVSSSLDPQQYVIAHEGLRELHLDRDVAVGVTPLVFDAPAVRALLLGPAHVHVR